MPFFAEIKGKLLAGTNPRKIQKNGKRFLQIAFPIGGILRYKSDEYNKF